MNKKILVIIVIVVAFIAAILLSNKLVKEDTEKTDETVSTNNAEVSVYTNENTIQNNNKETEDKFKEINKDSTVAQELFEFIPKSYQTYPWKLNKDYMLYEALSRLLKDDKVETVVVEGLDGYKYSDVELKVKEIFGESIVPEKEEVYSSPVGYNKEKDAYVLYPVGIDSTDNMMVIKSVEENSKMYKVTVYSVCVFVDTNENDSSSVYIMTKDTMKKYYSLTSRNDSSIKETYKKYKLTDSEFDPEIVAEELKEDLPQIEYYITKLPDTNKYYISDIKDIY